MAPIARVCRRRQVLVVKSAILLLVRVNKFLGCVGQSAHLDGVTDIDACTFSEPELLQRLNNGVATCLWDVQEYQRTSVCKRA